MYIFPRPMGTQFVKKKGKYLITYEVVGYFPGFPRGEMVEEVSRNKLNEDQCIQKKNF